MARRGKTSTAEDLMDLVAILPWWAGVALAVVSYLVLSPIAARPLDVAAAGGTVRNVGSAALVKGLATAGQYVLPIICLAGAGLSAFRRRQRQKLLDSASRSPGSSAVDGMRWQEFEQLVSEAFRRQGYQVSESGGGGADGGVDLVLSRPAQDGTEKTLVQCKHWRAYKVSVEVVRELYGVMAARGAAAGVVVTSGRFTEEAQAFAQGRNVKLVDGPALQRLIRDAQSRRQDTPRRGAMQSAQTAATQAPVLTDSPNAPPACPSCRKPMVQRTARHGAQAGGHFWGCTGFPACRSTRSMAER